MRRLKMCPIVLLLLVILVDRICLGHSPLNMAIITGQPVTMSCGLQSFNGLIRWTFQSVTSREAKFLFNGYNITRGLRKHFINGSQPGEFNLANKDPGLEDAGNYQCIRAIRNEASYRMEYNIAQLTVLSSAPNCGSDASNHGIVEGDLIRMWCGVDYLGNLNPVMEWSRKDGSIVNSTSSYINSSDKFILTTTASETIPPKDHNVTYICKTYFKTPAMAPEKSDTFTANNAPDYIDECKITITVLSGPWNMSITPRKTAYLKGDRLHCSATGNPLPAYSWEDVDTGYAVEGTLLTVDDTMVQRRVNTYRCTAENVLSGKRKTAVATVTFTVDNVEATTMDSSSGRSLIFLVGTGAAVGGIAVTVVGVILWRMTKRKCHHQLEENEYAKRCDSPNDYESVNSGVLDATQDTQYIEMDQLSTIAKHTVYQSMTVTEEDMACAKTLNHYDTLDSCRPIQEPRLYVTLPVQNTVQQIGQAKEENEKSNEYLALIEN